MTRTTWIVNTISYNPISACGKRQEWQLAVGLISSMAQAKVEANTTSPAISACEKGQEWQLAVGLISTMTMAKSTVNTIS